MTDTGLHGGLLARNIERQRLDKEAEDREREHAEREARRLEETKPLTPMEAANERNKVYEHQRKLEAENAERQLKSKLRARYLEVPGTSEQAFEEAYPRLKAQHAERVALGHEDEVKPAGFADPKMWGL